MYIVHDIWFMFKLILAFFVSTYFLYKYILHIPMMEQWEEQYRLLSWAYRLAYNTYYISM